MQHMPIAFSGGIDARIVDLPEVLLHLVEHGHLTPGLAARVASRARRINSPLEDVLQFEFGIDEQLIAQANSAVTDVPLVNPQELAPFPELIEAFGLQNSLRERLLPWRKFGSITVILVACKRDYLRNRKDLEHTFGPTTFAISVFSKIERVLIEFGAERLAFDAETNLNGELSCRTLRFGPKIGIVTLTAGCAFYLSANHTFLIAYLWVVFVLTTTTVFKLVAATRHTQTPDETQSETVDPLPTISLLIPLLNEKEVVPKLIEHLQKLSYPRAKLEAFLIIEDDDIITHAALESAPRPPWIKVSEPPIGVIRTKPRALNYTLCRARGDIIGVYDAEDLPASDQLLSVARAFREASSNTACVQGILDYHNSCKNWLSRCFTIEYASWFRVVLPGFARMGLLVPLGGTTLFFRRKILEEIGGWDAHNVTEDADLGVRLARRGYQTVFIDSVTQEEANARIWPWIKQRSRWLKGYAVTYCVHMRHPLRLLRDLGLWKFFGFQLLFLGTLTQFVLAPLLWSTLLVPFGVPHPITNGATLFYVSTLTLLFLSCTAINLAINCIGVHRAGKRWLMPWALTLIFYFPLGTLGAFKGLSELIRRPFYWDKTEHGIDLPD